MTSEDEVNELLPKLLEKHPKSRFWAYLIFSLVSFLIAAAANLIVFGLIPEESLAEFTKWLGWINAILNLAGTGFGITAASNVQLPKK